MEVTVGIELDDIGADGRVGQGVEDVEHVAGGEAAGFVVGDAGGEGRVEDVEVEREVEGRLEGCDGRPPVLVGVYDFYAETVGLLAQVRCGGADAE